MTRDNDYGRWAQKYSQALDEADQEIQANIYHWAGYAECIACGDFFAPQELSELGFCPMCEEELQQVEAGEATK